MCGDYKVCNVCNYSYGNVQENELDARHEMTCAMFITLAKKDNISSAFFFVTVSVTYSSLIMCLDVYSEVSGFILLYS